MTFDEWKATLADHLTPWFREKYGRWPQNNQHLPPDADLRLWHSWGKTWLWAAFRIKNPEECQRIQEGEQRALEQLRRDFPEDAKMFE